MKQYSETVQFVRLLAEISMAGPDRELLEQVGQSMDLEVSEIHALLIMAEKRYEQLINASRLPTVEQQQFRIDAIIKGMNY